MNTSLSLFITEFLRKKLLSTTPILIGFSGGPDSRALLHLLIGALKESQVQIHIAHIDHGWRVESSAQAKHLSILAKQLGCTFHLRTLNQLDFKEGNKEDQARNLRNKFFSEIYSQINAQALFLAHQKDDLSETVLKRIFEGASIFAIPAMREESTHSNMRILRPLLSWKKSTLISFLNEKGFDDYIVDETNLSSDNLRGKLRTEVFPYLEKIYGKQIISSLYDFSIQLKEVVDPLKEEFTSYISYWIESAFCDYICFDRIKGLKVNQRALFLKFILDFKKIPVSKKLISQIIKAIDSRQVKNFTLDGRQAFVDKMRLFLPKPIPSTDELRVAIADGVLKSEKFKIDFSVVEDKEVGKSSSWEDVLNGVCTLQIPEGSMKFLFPNSKEGIIYKKKLMNKYSSYGVPSFLRCLFPFVIYNDALIYDFLSGGLIVIKHSQQIKKVYLLITNNLK
ncbi:MAG: tRNA lysidine(34) synthetase TilS [Chlamydiae bacterium]|nr:tRNA lysidine(34) synthetase TilS [Chlamydiota bacterium]